MILYYKKGRPKKVTEDKPYTSETYWKNKHNLTSEPIDLLLKRGIINEEMHQAALKFRWLYTLKFSVPTLQTNFSATCTNKGGVTSQYTEDQRSQLVILYNDACKTLKRSQTLKIVQSVCIYHYHVENMQDSYSKNIELLQTGLHELYKKLFNKIYH